MHGRHAAGSAPGQFAAHSSKLRAATGKMNRRNTVKSQRAVCRPLVEAVDSKMAPVSRTRQCVSEPLVPSVVVICQCSLHIRSRSAPTRRSCRQARGACECLQSHSRLSTPRRDAWPPAPMQSVACTVEQPGAPPATSSACQLWVARERQNPKDKFIKMNIVPLEKRMNAPVLVEVAVWHQDVQRGAVLHPGEQWARRLSAQRHARPVPVHLIFGMTTCSSCASGQICRRHPERTGTPARCPAARPPSPGAPESEMHTARLLQENTPDFCKLSSKSK